jgi:hypothetical protein
MLRQLLRGITMDAPGIEVVAELDHTDLGSPDVLVADPDFIIVDLGRTSDEAVASLLRRRCGVRILGLSSDGRHGFLHELRPQKVSLGELSAAALVETIRGHGRRHP